MDKLTGRFRIVAIEGKKFTFVHEETGKEWEIEPNEEWNVNVGNVLTGTIEFKEAILPIQ